MKQGAMAAQLPAALAQADVVFCYFETSGKHALGWNPAQVLAPLGARASVHRDLQALAQAVADAASIRRAAGSCLKRVNLERRMRLLGVRVGALEVWSLRDDWVQGVMLLPQD